MHTVLLFEILRLLLKWEKRKDFGEEKGTMEF